MKTATTNRTTALSLLAIAAALAAATPALAGGPGWGGRVGPMRPFAGGFAASGVPRGRPLAWGRQIAVGPAPVAPGRRLGGGFGDGFGGGGRGGARGAELTLGALGFATGLAAGSSAGGRYADVAPDATAAIDARSCHPVRALVLTPEGPYRERVLNVCE